MVKTIHFQQQILCEIGEQLTWHNKNILFNKTENKSEPFLFINKIRMEKNQDPNDKDSSLSTAADITSPSQCHGTPHLTNSRDRTDTDHLRLTVP